MTCLQALWQLLCPQKEKLLLEAGLQQGEPFGRTAIGISLKDKALCLRFEGTEE